MTVAMVTGGSRGIGRAVVNALAKTGMQVVAVGRDEFALQQAAREDNVSAEVCDVSDEAAVQRLFDSVGRIDVLVNNAGTSTAAPVHRTSLGQWEEQMRVNATGVFLCTRAALPGMRERDHGRIVTVASTAGIAGSPYTAAYAASKHAAVGLTRVVAAEVAGSGVTANAVCPGFVRSDMTERSIDRISATTGRSREDALTSLEQSSPLGRLIEPGEVAATVIFLSSQNAATINGQTIILDGGGIQA